MNELRQEFEAHEEIAQAISDNEVYYDEDAECYIATAEEFMYDSGYLNGAWWAYQEQHKKIVAYQKALEIQKCFDEANEIFSSVERIANSMLHNGEYLIDTSTLDKPQQNTIVNIIDSFDDDKIKEIFMVSSNELHNNR